MPILKLFIWLQSRPLEQQQQHIQQQQQEGSNRNSSTSQGSTAGSEGSRGECPPAVEADPEWAPHVDLGKQMATLHALLVDSLPKLPAGRIQVGNFEHIDVQSPKQRRGLKWPQHL